jgi:predicted TIM-barrel fold metal-dependent hydrolase
MTNGIIDAWAQLSDGPGQLPAGVSEVFRRAGTSAAYWAGVDPDEVVGQMDAAGIAKLCVCAWHSPRGPLISNDQVASLVEVYPERFVGIASVALERPTAALAELERAVRELGFRGLRVVPWLWNRPPTDSLYYPLFAKCVELGIPFCTQAGHIGPAYPSAPGRPIPYLDRVALDFPELTIVAGYVGYPWTDEMIAVAWKDPNVYIDTSAWAPQYLPHSLRHFMRTTGREKVLFATNYTQMPLDRCFREGRALELPRATADRFLAEDAKEVFGLR